MFARKRRRRLPAGPRGKKRPGPLEMTPEEAAEHGAFRDDGVALEDVLAADEEPGKPEPSRGAA